MAKDAIVSEELAKKFATEKETPYTRWVRDEGLDIIGAHYVPDLHTVELKPWARRGAKGVYINHEASRTSNDCYVCEIAPGGKLSPQRQLYEEMILVLDGCGSTTVWNDAGAARHLRVEGPGALFAIPLNCLAPALQRLGPEPARYVAVTNAPIVINAYGDAGVRLQHAVRFQEPLLRRARLFRRQGRAEGVPARHQFRAPTPSTCR